MKQLFHITLISILLVSCTETTAPQAKKEDVSPTTESTLSAQSHTFPKADVVNVLMEVSGLPINGLPVRIEYYQWDNFYPISEQTLRNNQPLLIPLMNNYSIGLYRVVSRDIKNARPVYFVVNGQQAKIQISATYDNFMKGLAEVVPDDEMFVRAEVRKLFGAKMAVEDSIKEMIGKVTIINPKYYTEKHALREVMEQNSLKLYKNLDVLKEEFPETYFNKVVVNLIRKPSRYETESLKEAYETEAAMLNRHYFDGIDVNDNAWLGHPIFFQTINEYIAQYGGEMPDEWVTSVDYLMNHISSAAIKRTVADYLVFYYLDRQEENVAREIAFTHIEGCTDEYFTSLKQTDRYRSGPAIDASVPDFESYDKDGQAFRFSQLMAGQPITLLYFWKSDCPFCKEEHKVVKRLHELYGAQGLNIVGVSLDTDSEKWMKAMTDYKLDWMNLCDLRGTASPVVQEYVVRATPTTFIIDKQGKLVAKNLSGNTLTSFFKKYFNRSSS